MSLRVHIFRPVFQFLILHKWRSVLTILFQRYITDFEWRRSARITNFSSLSIDWTLRIPTSYC